MGKRSNFKRRKHDFYVTPEKAVLPLLPHLANKTRFVETCAGDGALIEILERHGHQCVFSCDIAPKAATIKKHDILAWPRPIPYLGVADYYITNPPWTRALLHPMIERLSLIKPTWLLFDAGWMNTKQAAPYKSYCVKIVSVGRVSWMGNGVNGMDDCAWYLFDNTPNAKKRKNGPEFIMREAA